MYVIVFCVWICSLKYHKALKRCELLQKSLLHFLHHKKRMFANVCFADEKNYSPTISDKYTPGKSRPK